MPIQAQQTNSKKFLKNSTWPFALGFFLLISILLFKFSFAEKSYQNNILVANKKIYVDIAKTSQELQTGLSGRKKLKQNQGMLFVFSEKKIQSFWMKDMKFNLDIIWINKNTIVGILENIKKPSEEQTELPTYESPIEVDMVLEVNAGWSKKNKIQIGDKIEKISK